MCADNAPASPFGVPWVKEDAHRRAIGSAEALSYELEDSGYLFARHVDCSMTSSMLWPGHAVHAARLAAKLDVYDDAARLILA